MRASCHSPHPGKRSSSRTAGLTPTVPSPSSPPPPLGNFTPEAPVVGFSPEAPELFSGTVGVKPALCELEHPAHYDGRGDAREILNHVSGSLPASIETHVEWQNSSKIADCNFVRSPPRIDFCSGSPSLGGKISTASTSSTVLPSWQNASKIGDRPFCFHPSLMDSVQDQCSRPGSL